MGWAEKFMVQKFNAETGWRYSWNFYKVMPVMPGRKRTEESRNIKKNKLTHSLTNSEIPSPTQLLTPVGQQTGIRDRSGISQIISDVSSHIDHIISNNLHQGTLVLL